MSSKRSVGILPPVPRIGLDLDLSPYRANQVKTRSLGWALIQQDCVLIKRRNVVGVQMKAEMG